MKSSSVYSVRIEHKKRMQSSGLNQSTLTSIMPSLYDQVVQDQLDDDSTLECCEEFEYLLFIIFCFIRSFVSDS